MHHQRSWPASPGEGARISGIQAPEFPEPTTRFHELAHVVLGHTTEHTNLTDDETTPRNLREVEAESVALLCLEVLGLPGSEFSRGYIQHWNHGNDPIPERSAQRILKATDTILKSGRTSAEGV